MKQVQQQSGLSSKNLGSTMDPSYTSKGSTMCIIYRHSIQCKVILYNNEL